MKAWAALLGRELRLAWRSGSAIGTVLGFYAIAVAMMPVAIGPDLNLLARIAPGVLWISMMLAALLSLGRLFERDHENGTLDLWQMGVMPLELVVAAKALAHWMTTCLPLVVITPVLGLFLNIEAGAVPMVVVTMLIGTVAISFLGAIAAALTLRSRRGGVLIALLVLPIYVPTLIYGIAATVASTTALGEAAISSLAMLGAISLIATIVGPVAAAAALRVQTG